jgi:hypothetical protein
MVLDTCNFASSSHRITQPPDPTKIKWILSLEKYLIPGSSNMHIGIFDTNYTVKYGKVWQYEYEVKYRAER